jgi:hypothetical protein
MRIVDAANVTAPAYLAILSKGYAVRNGGGLMIAERDGNWFAAQGPVALLGLIAMAEIRGEAWHASDEEIGEYLAGSG